jgi:hypothetical protein
MYAAAYEGEHTEAPLAQPQPVALRKIFVKNLRGALLTLN